MELRETEESPLVEKNLDALKLTLKKVANIKEPGRDGIHGFQLKGITSIHDWLAQQVHKCLQ